MSRRKRKKEQVSSKANDSDSSNIPRQVLHYQCEPPSRPTTSEPQSFTITTPLTPSSRSPAQPSASTAPSAAARPPASSALQPLCPSVRPSGYCTQALPQSCTTPALPSAVPISEHHLPSHFHLHAHSPRLPHVHSSFFLLPQFQNLAQSIQPPHTLHPQTHRSFPPGQTPVQARPSKPRTPCS
jgi:hypothetical protein